MINFLIHRPIAVSMAFIGVLVLGFIATTYLPVSLVPDVDIPRITVNVEAPDYSARELEKSTMDRLRMNLMQVNNVNDIQSETRDGSGNIILEFSFGTNIDLAYIEVNEQIDKASAGLPRDIPRPTVVKASASDIPVFYLNISTKSHSEGRQHHGHNPGRISDDFMELSNFADEIIRRRIEQLPEVAMADMSGRVFSEIVIIPDMEKLRALNIPIETIENTILRHNISLGNLIIRDKQYQYNVRFGSRLLNIEDISGLYLNHKGRLWQIGDLCEIVKQPQTPTGLVFSKDKPAVSIAIIKQADARMQTLKNELHQMVSYFEEDYPHIEFEITQDQTKLLDYTMMNLQQSLYIGAFLAFMVMFVFLRDYKSPWLVIISVPAALIISLLGFYLAGISLNIVSLSGLILCIGIMIDNSIIVIDNITQHRERGKSLSQACIDGTGEVFRPLLSAVLTTCSVFIPLIFLGGLAGALFFDQAIAITIGLFVSLAVAMVLLPVYYRLFYQKSKAFKATFLSKLNPLNYQKLYSKGFRFVMRNQGKVWIMFILMFAGMIALYFMVDKERLPSMERQEVVLWIDWNENVHLDESNDRLFRLKEHLSPYILQSTVYSGRQQFLLGTAKNTSEQQAYIYINTPSRRKLYELKDEARQYFRTHYPSAFFRFEEAENLFDMIFAERQAPLVVRLRPVSDYGYQTVDYLQATLGALQQELPGVNIESVPVNQYIELRTNTQLLALHQVSPRNLERVISRAFRENKIITIQDSRSVIPVILGGDEKAIGEILHSERVTNANGVEIPLNRLIVQRPATDLKSIIAGAEGDYYPVEMDIDRRSVADVMQTVRSTLSKDNHFEAGFTGSIFAQRELIRELVIIGVVALLLLFFILAAQFESLRLPFIVLLEVPIAMFGALLMLKIFGETVNVMSMIGMVVMAGIIINDSILKIDTINRLRDSGMPLIKALLTGGHYRLKPILMTSITTILALLPFLFIKGLGGDLQKPLALAVIGGMTIGTLVSLYFIPICYYYLYRKRRGKVGSPQSAVGSRQ